MEALPRQWIKRGETNRTLGRDRDRHPPEFPSRGRQGTEALGK
jgi:hypothetical protein